MRQKLTLGEYRHWHRDYFGEDLESDAIRRRYQANLTLAQAGIAAHPFVRDAANSLEDLSKQKTFSLLGTASGPDLTFQTKPFSSVVDKTYRINCNWNRNFPEPPGRGWIKSTNWFSTLDDLLRTSLVCKYIDGPALVCTTLSGVANTSDLSARFFPRATEDGYYAYHLYVEIPVSLMLGENNEIASVAMKTEIQVTTQLQEILRDLTHPIYKERRISVRPDPRQERWDYDSSHFRASYLGHTLHLIESMIVELRDRSVREAESAEVAQGEK